MRAVGRPTPAGAWAGVAEAQLRSGVEQTTRVEFVVDKVPIDKAATPDLLALRPALRMFSRRAHYRRERELHVNPTLHATTKGWSVVSSGHDWATIPSHPVYEMLIDAFSSEGIGGARSSARVVVNHVARAFDDVLAARDSLFRVVDLLIDRGVLCTSLDQPVEVPDPWEALDAIARRLADEDRGVWVATVDRLRETCEQLSDRYPTLTAVEVANLEADARGSRSSPMAGIRP